MDLADAIQDLYNASITPASKRKTKVKATLEQIHGHALQYGLQTAQLSALLEILTEPNHLDLSNRNAIIKSLYPLQDPSSEDILLIARSLGIGEKKAPLQTQVGLLKWINTIFDTLRDISILRQCYSVLFTLLDVMILRSSLCQLLSRLTSRKHVQPFRIQQLLELSRNNPGEAPVVGLLRTFKTFNHDIILGDLALNRTSYFAHPSLEWLERLRSIREVYASSSVGESDRRTSRRQQRALKRESDVGIPDVTTLDLSEGQVAIEELNGPEELIEKLEWIARPNQMASVIRDKLFREYLNLCPHDDAAGRLETWLTAYLEDELVHLFAEKKTSASLKEVLQRLVEFGESQGQLPSTVARFLDNYLEAGFDAIDNALLGRLIVVSAGETEVPDLQRFEYHVLDGGEESLQDLLKTQSRLLVRLARQADGVTNASVNAAMISATYARLANRMLILCLTVMENFPNSQLSISSVLSAMEIHAALMVSDAVPTIIPPPNLVYCLLFEPSISTVSRLCRLLTDCKACVLARKGTSRPDVEIILQLNSYLVDVCNCLWRNRNFNADDEGAKACLLHEEGIQGVRDFLKSTDDGPALSAALSFSHHPLFAAIGKIVIEHWVTSQRPDDAPPITVPTTQKSLDQLQQSEGLRLGWSEYRKLVLEWLNTHQLDGLGRLIRATVSPN